MTVTGAIASDVLVARHHHHYRDVVAITEPAGRPGRPRRFNEAQELELLLDAAFEVIKAKGYQAVTVADILAEAGLSTRSFYRHFAAKDDLLAALFRRDAEQFAAKVTARVTAAADPLDAVLRWVDEILAFGYDRGRSKRAAVLGAPAAMRTLGPDATVHALRLLLVPLTEALASGVADGSLPGADPTHDAALISAMAWDTSMRMGDASTRVLKDAARDATHAFVLRALGAGPSST
jgi:AcrR family transcriptional regulator